MIDISIEESAPALVLIVPKSIGASSHPTSPDSEYAEDHDGNVFVGLKYAMVIYALAALGIATGWRLFHLFS